jgi:hypothetical protein
MISLMQQIIAILLIVAIGTAYTGSCNSVITRAQYDSIQMSWTRDQVTKAVGSPGNPIFESATTMTIQYKDVTAGSSASITFYNGAVYTKIQADLC